MKLKVIDLFRGLGGASQAFVDAGDEVLRIENNVLLKDVPHTHHMDVTALHAFLVEYAVGRDDYDLVWASPPCYEFSNAYGGPKARAHRAGEEHNPSTALIEISKDIIDLLEPRWWVIENVRGACPWVNPILGEPTQVVDSLVLWGHFPSLYLPDGWKHRKAEQDRRWSPIRANHRAKIPLEVSQALRQAITSQQKII